MFLLPINSPLKIKVKLGICDIAIRVSSNRRATNAPYCLQISITNTQSEELFPYKENSILRKQHFLFTYSAIFLTDGISKYYIKN